MSDPIFRTAEHVSCGHPDKFCDQVADRILDCALDLAGADERDLATVRTAIECLAKDRLLVVSGEMRLPARARNGLDIVDLARDVWREIGYGDDPAELTVIDHVRSQSADISLGTGSGVDSGGAGDQGIMIGYATDETPEMMPREWVLARDICHRLRDLRLNGELPWLRSDCKSQVTLGPDGTVVSVVIAAQHSTEIETEDIEENLKRLVIEPLLDGQTAPPRVSINGTGRFTIGGPAGDAGVVGRKIVVDAYGPRVPVGGGAYSGKDPTKVDRSAAYMARHIAKTIVSHGIAGAHECTVTLAFAIGQHQPEMVTAITDAGKDVSSWVTGSKVFSDLSPNAIIDRLGLRRPQGWSYFASASYGHFGRAIFPWERIPSLD